MMHFGTQRLCFSHMICPIRRDESVALDKRENAGSITIVDLLNGLNVQMLPTSITFKQAEKAQADQPQQKGLFDKANNE